MDVTTSQKDLGVISPNLTSSSHYNMICAKAYSSLNFICKNSLRSYCTYCQVPPMLSNCGGTTYFKDTANLEQVQRKATKYILNDYN